MAENQREKIGRYEILSELGRGAMGVVYKARDPNIDRIVAIKAILQSEFADAPEGDEMQERFRREVQTAGLLTHSNIVTVYDGGIDGELHWIAMEYINGPSLKQMISERHELKVDEAAAIVAKVCSAMEFAHKRQIIHRDLKPANILMTDEGEPKVTDFGIARIESSTMTKTGVILGTPSYMSPEQVTGQRIDFRSDIYSLGILLYELLTGERPFTGENPTSIMYKIVHTDPVPPDRLDPTLPEELSAIAMRALAKRPRQRFESAGEMAEALYKVAGKGTDRMVGTGRMTAETAQMDSDRIAAAFDHYEKVDDVHDFEAQPKRKALPILLVLLLLVIGGGGAYWWFFLKDDLNFGLFSSAAEPTVIEKPLTIQANVDDFSVFINGNPLAFQEDGTVLLRGEHRAVLTVEVRKDCYQSATDSVVLDDTSPLERSFTLHQETRTVQIVTEPEGAAVRVNGNNVGNAPVEVELTCGETVSIAATADGFNSFNREFAWAEIPEQGPLQFNMEPINFGTVTFTGPYKVKVNYASNGRALDRNEVGSLRLKPGKYSVNLTNREVFLNMAVEFDVPENGEINVPLPPLEVLSINSTPPPNSMVINGFDVDMRTEMPMRERQFATGTIRITFDWGDVQGEKVIDLKPGDPQRVTGLKSDFSGGEQ